jgi:hypothetical protein
MTARLQDCCCGCCGAAYRYKKKVKRQKLPLASFLTLDPFYFPEELYSDKAKK